MVPRPARRFAGARLRLAGERAAVRTPALAYRCLSRRLGPRMRAFGPEVIVVTEMWPAVLLSPLKARGAVAAPVVGVFTDYRVHDLWV